MTLFSAKQDHARSNGRNIEPSLAGRVVTMTDKTILFKTMVRRLSHTLKKITHRLNPHSSFIGEQDLFQEALIQVWNRFDAGGLDDKTDSYILQGCYFHLKNYLRKNQDRPALVSMSSIMEQDGLEEVFFADDLACYDYLEGVLEIEAIESGMNEREKDVLFLSLEGMTTREIGKKLGVSHVSVVKTRNRIKENYERLSREKETSK